MTGSDADSAPTPLAASLQRCGIVIALVFLALVPLSFGIAAVSPFGVLQEREQDALARFVGGLPLLPEDATGALQDLVRGDSFLQDRATRATLYGTLFLVATLAVMRALWLLVRGSATPDRASVDRLFRFALLFAAIQVFAYPMFTQDFWLSVSWGRMAAAGVNPYYEFFTAASLEDVPLEGWIFPRDTRMTYGPLWAAASALLTMFAGGLAVLEFLFFKLTLAAAWVLGLWCVRRTCEKVSQAHAAVAVCLYGWLPMSSHTAIAEGHNDVVMVALLLVWLHLVWARRQTLAPFALVASALVKYVTAPLLLLEWWHGSRGPSRRGPYLLAVLASLLGGAGLVLLFARDTQLLTTAAPMRSWRLLTPSSALGSLAQQAGFYLPSKLADGTVALALLALLGLAVPRRYLREGRCDDLTQLVFVALAAAALIFVGHTWPWFLLWPLAAGSLVWTSRPMRWLLAYFLLAPFLHLYWILAPKAWGATEPTNILAFTIYLLLAWPASRLLFSSEQTTEDARPFAGTTARQIG